MLEPSAFPPLNSLADFAKILLILAILSISFPVFPSGSVQMYFFPLKLRELLLGSVSLLKGCQVSWQ